MIESNIKLFEINEYMVANIVKGQYYGNDTFKVHIPLLMPYITPEDKVSKQYFTTNSLYINEDNSVKVKGSVTEKQYLNLTVLPNVAHNIWTDLIKFPDYTIPDKTKIMVYSIDKNINRMFIQSVIPEV